MDSLISVKIFRTYLAIFYRYVSMKVFSHNSSLNNQDNSLRQAIHIILQIFPYEQVINYKHLYKMNDSTPFQKVLNGENKYFSKL